MFRRFCAALVVAVAVGVPGVAWAEPASIDDGSGPRDVGARIDDGSGVPGPDWSVPAEKPSRGDFPAGEKGDSDYRIAVGLWAAGEAGRVGNLEMQGR